MILIKEFEFDAAHNLINYHGKCERLHGHTYKLVVKLEGTRDHEDMLYDFVELKNLVKEQVLVEAVLIIKRAQISDFNQGVKPAKLSYLFLP